MAPTSTLVIIKFLHTVVWALMAGVIVVIPVFIVRRQWQHVLVLIGIVFVECVVLAVNGMRCPLTDLAAHYTTSRADNFDIYLPLWLARHNKTVFGSLFVLGELFVLWRWMITSQ
jgi:hypothetical protein